MPLNALFEIPLWEPMFSPENLVKKQNDLGMVSYNRGFRQQAMSEDTKIFPEDKFQYFDLIKDTMRTPVGWFQLNELSLAMGVDLATKKTITADYFAVACVGVHLNNIFIIDVWRDRLSPVEQIKVLKKEFIRWKRLPAIIVVEEVGYQAALRDYLTNDLEIKLPMKGVTPLKDKVSRATPLSIDFENGRVFIRSGLQELVQELRGFPLAEVTDDMVDATVMAVYGAVHHGRIGSRSSLSSENIRKTVKEQKSTLTDPTSLRAERRVQKRGKRVKLERPRPVSTVRKDDYL